MQVASWLLLDCAVAAGPGLTIPLRILYPINPWIIRLWVATSYSWSRRVFMNHLKYIAIQAQFLKFSN
jgi:hypothetical protein